ncbi:MAG: glutamyl-tRNA reductase [Pelotomaculum sp.]|uniref:Glutamyl-tRNA reductase n=1 Tax=Pelotomaculum thermopropionicum (strain DSM 13744 / JCM 10971 / SI) TaxID=370438 RepID=HEM1_PELTS|nr:RecName: Full=Glutamyl-tRNA reductase; Short=GluTR [Pelotomaculum thermopropionicum SI]NPV73381.1 glutamyl-tRNA reductase [Pelotomaculum sp.]BAF59152.1 glutamyl-tRNA reductase [Pelotomaculum thermopropionicum SI]
MLILVVGLNHRTAPVEVREKLSFSAKSLQGALAQLKSYPVIEGCAILSTCNRTEIYAATLEMDDGLNAIWDFLSRWSGVGISEIKNFTYSHTLYDTIRHLFRVAAGLDSMILGETQILGQVREAYQRAIEYESTNRVLNTLFQQAITVGKRVRTETGIDRNAVSISYAAVELARQHLGSLDGRSVLVIGAGKMSELTARHLVANGVSSVIVSNRSFERAVALAEQFRGRAVRFDELYRCMEAADIVISCTAASHCVVKAEEVSRVMDKRRGRAIFMVDIAVPRDIEAEVGNLAGVTLFDIDDLKNVIDQNLAERKQAAVKAEEIIEEELDGFMKWLGMQFVVPTISALKKWGDEIKQKELCRALNRLGNISEHDRKVICSMANSIVNQILHVPVAQLKSYALTTEGHLYTEILQNLFNLDVPGQKPKKQPAPAGIKEPVLAKKG